MSDGDWYQQKFGSGVAKAIVSWIDAHAGGAQCVPLDYAWLVNEFEFTEKQLGAAIDLLVRKGLARIESLPYCSCQSATHVKLLHPAFLAWEEEQRKKEAEKAAERAARRALKVAARGGQVNRKAIPDVIKARVYARDNFACVKCGATDDLSLDHIHPWSLGGPDTEDNLRVLCRPCNSRKGDRT